MNLAIFKNIFKDINYMIVDHKSELEKHTYDVSYSEVLSDGAVHTERDDNKNCLIAKVTNASYVTFIDNSTPREVHLIVYVNILDSALHHIRNQVNTLIKYLNSIQNTNTEEDSNKVEEPLVDITQLHQSEAIRQFLVHEEGLMDINNMICDICGSTEFKDPEMCNDMKTIECQCKKCFTIFRLIPSKYYIVHSRTVFLDTAKNRITKNIHYTKPRSLIDDINKISLKETSDNGSQN